MILLVGKNELAATRSGRLTEVVRRHQTTQWVEAEILGLGNDAWEDGVGELTQPGAI
jgi:hypothetical protein